MSRTNSDSNTGTGEVAVDFTGGCKALLVMENSTLIKLIALNRGNTVSEETFTVKELKAKYPKLWLKCQSDYPVFINLCLGKWIEDQKDLVFNVATFNIE